MLVAGLSLHRWIAETPLRLTSSSAGSTEMLDVPRREMDALKLPWPGMNCCSCSFQLWLQAGDSGARTGVKSWKNDPCPTDLKQSGSQICLVVMQVPGPAQTVLDHEQKLRYTLH